MWRNIGNIAEQPETYRNRGQYYKQKKLQYRAITENDTNQVKYEKTSQPLVIKPPKWSSSSFSLQYQYD